MKIFKRLQLVNEMITQRVAYYNHGVNILRIFDVLPIFFHHSPQVKRSVSIRNKHDIYKLPQKLLRL